MGKIRYLFFDLDGTLLDDEKHISPVLISYLHDLKSRKQVRYAFSTGRHVVSVEPYLEKHGLRSLFDGMVCNSGADIIRFNPPEHHKNHYLTPAQLQLVLDAFGGLDFVTVAFHNGHRLVANGMNRQVRCVLERNGYLTAVRPEDCCIAPSPKGLLLFDPADRERVRQAIADAALPGLRGAFTEPNMCEVLDLDISKASGVRTYLEPCGVGLEEIMVFGDAENDRQLLSAAGISVCMKNGSAEIQAIADYVTEKTNNEDGILDFLQKHEDFFQEAL